MNAFVLIFCSVIRGTACQEIPPTWPWTPQYCGEVITAGFTSYGRGVIMAQCPIEGQSNDVALPTGVLKMTDTHGWHKPRSAPTDRPFLAWCPDATIPFTVVQWSDEFKNFTRIDTRGLTANFAFWMELPKGPHGDKGGK